MNLSHEALRDIGNTYQTAFNKGLAEAESHYRKIAMVTKSTSAATVYPWLGDTPTIREWIGDRVIKQLTAHGYKIENRLFEQTISVKRTEIEDDQYGVYAPLFEKMGADTQRHPDELVFSLLKLGFATACFDGQYFFDTDHAVISPETGAEVSVSNMQAGSGAPWFLLDCSQPIKPMIYQERLPFEFAKRTEKEDETVFNTDRYTYGVRGRSNVGFGLWQLAYASKAELTAANYEAARVAMHGFKSDNGKTLGIKGTHLVVPPALEGPGRRLLKALLDNGGTNEWAGSAELIVSHFLA